MDKIVIKFKEAIRVNASFYLKFDDETGKLQLLAGKDSEVLSEVDLPTEKIITNAFYDDTTKELVIDFESAKQVRIPIDFTDEIEKAISDFENNVNEQFEQINKKIDDLENTINNNIGKQVESLNKSIEEINNSKVDKVDGKQLSTNDLTNELLDKLNDLKNYDDSQLVKRIESIEEILKSNDLDLDTLQKIANAIKGNYSTLNEQVNAISQALEKNINELREKIDSIEPDAIIDVSSIDELGATPVPESGLVEKVYFNTKLPLEETLAIFDSLNFILLDENETEKYYIWACLTDESMEQNMIAIMKKEETYSEGIHTTYTIIAVSNGSTLESAIRQNIFEWSSVNGIDSSLYDENGWLKDFDGTGEFNIENQLLIIANILVGFTLENDKAVKLFSISQFVEISEQVLYRVSSNSNNSGEIKEENVEPKLYHIKNGEKYQIRTAPIIDVEELPQNVPSENIAVPYDTKVDTIYFNTNLSIDEVKAIIDKVYASKPSATGYWYPFSYQNDDGTLQKSIMIDDEYGIAYVEILNGDINPIEIFTSTNGWMKGNISINEINNFPSHNEHDYDEYALNVLGQELVYTKTKEIKADIDAKSLYRVTKKDTGGIVVPNTGYVENVYFNTNLSVDEVVSLLSQLNYTNSVYGLLCKHIYIDNDWVSLKLGIFKFDDLTYAIVDPDNTLIYFATENIPEMPLDFVGWNPSFNGEIIVNGDVLDSFQNISYGTQNDKLIDLISTNNLFGIKKGSSKLYHFANDEWLELGNSADDNNDEEKINQIEEKVNENSNLISELIERGLALEEKNNTQDTSISNAQQTANEALAIAKGRTKATVFETYSSMTEYLKSATNSEFNIGDNLLIKELNVPDYWVSAILETNDGIYGYYEVSLLETQKVDLTNYYDITKTDELLNTKLDSAIELTYSELKTLRDNSQLVVGATYIINDYTYVPPFSVPFVSGNHIFDIILIADSENTLNENARAKKHEGDTYFANNDLSAWELKYTLENNKNGRSSDKGVIYWLKDEFDNECSYDFKNILLPKSMLYKNDKLNSSIDYYYTFSIINSSDNTVIDSSISKNNNVYQNKICSTSITNVFIGNNYYRNTLVDCKNVVINYSYSNDNFFSQVDSLFVGNSNYIRQCTLKDCLEIILNGLDYSNFTRVQYCNNTSMVHSFNVSKVGGTSENYLNFSKIQVNYKTPTNVTVGSVLEQYQNYGKIHAYWVDNETLQIVGKYLESNSDTEWKEITNN